MEKVLRKHLPGGGFTNVPEKRSRTMAAVRGKGNRTTERRLRCALAAAGIRGWKMHPYDIPGCPDFWFPRARLAVFVDGCFWHGCPKCGHLPRTNAAFWKAKFERNKARDRRVTRRLRQQGVAVIRIWECQIRAERAQYLLRIRRALIRRST